jgi:DNA-binding MarR family transcriptional regulator
MRAHPIHKNLPELEETLLRFRRKLSDTLRERSRRLQCPLSQMDAISFIAERNRTTMKEIAEYLKIAPPSATAMIETMRKHGLVTRAADKRDRRTIRVELTGKAERLFRKFHRIKLDIFARMLGKLSDAEQKRFIRMMQILIQD